MSCKKSYIARYFPFLLILLLTAGCSVSPRVKLDPESEDFYETARLIITKQEKDIFLHLPDKEARKAFIREFWIKRDPIPDTEINEFKQEFFRRIEYANERFQEGIPGWKTDRGRIYIYFGEPDQTDQRPMLNRPDIKGWMIWYYYRYNFAVEFIDTRGDNTYTMDPYAGVYGNSLFDAIELAQFGIIYAQEQIELTFTDFTLHYDIKKQAFAVEIPMKNLTFVDDQGMLKADFDFTFSIYQKKASKIDEFKATHSLAMTEEEALEEENIVFSFPYELNSGKYYIDVIIIILPDESKIRKIFDLSI